MKDTTKPVMKPLSDLNLLDRSLLAPGEVNFNQLPDVTLITIAPFDLFGEGKYCYTFRMKCGEAENLYLEDGAVRIFLNTRGTNGGDVREEAILSLVMRKLEKGKSAEQIAEELEMDVSEIEAFIGECEGNHERG